MSEVKLGQFIDKNAQRDAIHIAIAPVISDEMLYAGQHVGFVEPDNFEKVSAKVTKFIGIIDPFLADRVFPGKRCWLCLYPQTTTPMRHDWSHPAFAVSADKSKSKEWLQAFATTVGISYSGLLDAFATYRTYQDMLQGERIEGCEGFQIPDDFWDHYEILTGSKVKDRPTSFSCDC